MVREELVGAVHPVEGVEAPLQEVVQHADTREPRGRAHHHQRGMDEGLAHHAVEAVADVDDQLHLAFPLLAVAHRAERAAILRHGELPGAAGQLRQQQPVELLRQRVDLHRQRDGRDHALGKHPHHQRHDAREVGVAAGEVAAVEVRLEERDGVGIARLRGEIGVGRAKTARLPDAQPVERLRQHRVALPVGVQRLHACELAQQCILRGMCARGRDRGSHGEGAGAGAGGRTRSRPGEFSRRTDASHAAD